MADTNDNRTITIYDIAKEAEVSPSTVSRVLTGSANVRPEKKEKILNLIEKYNFKPNALAKGLSDTCTKVIGVVAADIRNPFYASTFVACEKAANERGYKVLLYNSFGLVEKEIAQLETLSQQKVDAIIQLGGRVEDVMTDLEYAKVAKKISAQIPMAVTGKIDGVVCNRVVINAVEASRMLTEHLIENGHTRIAMVGGQLDNTSTYEKYITYRNILKQNGIPFRSEYIISGTYDHEFGYEGVRKLLELKERPTAIIAINDISAAGILRRLTECKIRVPEDISVVGYDNSYISELLSPTLTSIDYDYDKLGHKLVDAALASIEGKSVATLQTIVPKLVVRSSSGKCNK